MRFLLLLTGQFHRLSELPVSEPISLDKTLVFPCMSLPNTGFCLILLSFYAQTLKVLLQPLACVYNFQNNSIVLHILPLTSSCQKICVWKCRDLCWITLRGLLAFSKKATSYGKEIHCKRAVSTLRQYVISIHLFPNDASFLLRMPIFVHLQRTDVSFISLGLPGCLPGSISGATVTTFQSSCPLLYPDPGGGSAVTQQM